MNLTEIVIFFLCPSWEYKVEKAKYNNMQFGQLIKLYFCYLIVFSVEPWFIFKVKISFSYQSTYL